MILLLAGMWGIVVAFFRDFVILWFRDFVVLLIAKGPIFNGKLMAIRFLGLV